VADPLLHLSSGILVKAALDQRPLGAFAFGAVLPDLASRLPSLGFERALAAGVPVPRALMTGWSVFHQPVGAAVLCGLLASLFVPEQRRDVFVGLYAGVAFHLLVDLLQFHHGQGYALLFPASDAVFELGWIGSESTLWLTLPVTVVAFVTWRWRVNADHGRNRRTPAPTDVRHQDT
jgi:membrane-bound metal-dependent hydrolase YbcI (DUF457 family)